MVETYELWRYATVLKHRYFDAFTKLPWEELVRDRDASFNSIRNIFLHIVNVEDFYGSVLSRNAGKYNPYDFDGFNNMESIRRQMNEVEAKTKECLSSLGAEGLAREFEWTRPDGVVVMGMGEDIVLHLALEQIHHFGELISLLWQTNVEPPHLGWLQYSREARTR